MAEIAARQHGVVEHRQLLWAGLSHPPGAQLFTSLSPLLVAGPAPGHWPPLLAHTHRRRHHPRHNIPVTTKARTLADLGWSNEPTRSHLERTFLGLLRSHELPLAEVNARLGPYEVDFLWRSELLVVETDGWEFHRSRTAFEADRRRDRELQARGFVVLRFTYREVMQAPGAVVASLRAHLPRRRGLGFQRGLARRQHRHPGEGQQ
jgi:very-short-patch-repair endonuclease